MARYRYTLIFNAQGKEPVGHSERWDFEKADDSAAAQFATFLASRRAQFMPLGWKIQSVRVGRLTAFQRQDHTWRWKQVGVHLCIPPTQSGSGIAEATGGAVYYRFQYTPGSGRPAVRLFTPVPEIWFNGSSTGPASTQESADGEIQPLARWLKSNGHRLYAIDKTTGSPTDSTLSCVTFQRSAVKKLGRPFNLRRGRRFAHRTHRP
jgi:hypothetical protein